MKNLDIMSLVFGRPQTKAECVYVASFLPGSFLWALSKTVQASCPVLLGISLGWRWATQEADLFQ